MCTNNSTVFARWRQCAPPSNTCCRRSTSAASPPAGAAAVDRRDRQTDGRTEGRTHDRFMTLTAYYADRVITLLLLLLVYYNYIDRIYIICLQCFDTVGWTSRRASGLLYVQLVPNSTTRTGPDPTTVKSVDLSETRAAATRITDKVRCVRLVEFGHY